VVRDVQTRRGVALGVEVDDQDAVAVQGQSNGDVDDARRLPYAALLVRHAEDAHLGRPRHLDLAARIEDLNGALRLLSQRRVLDIPGLTYSIHVAG